MNTAEIINWMIDNKKGLTLASKKFGIPVTTLRWRIDKIEDEKLIARYDRHVEKMKSSSKKSRCEDNLIAIYFMQQKRVTSSDILNYSLKMKNETPVAKIIELLEMSGKRVIRA